MIELLELMVLVSVAVVAAVVGVRLGIVLFAPRISRAFDRDTADGEADDGHDRRD